MRARSIFALGIMAALGATSARAQVGPHIAKPHNGSGTEQMQPQTETPAVAVGGGRVVFIDPATGKIRQPDAAEIGRLIPPAAAKAVVSPPLTTKIGPGGAVGVVLDGRFDSYTVVTKRPDGTLAMDCVTGADKAAEVVSHGVNASKSAAHRTLNVQ